jgi:hypothetical protein
MNNLPIIRDTPPVLASDCCPRPGGEKLLHRVPRTPITRAITNDNPDDVLQDEAGFAILDEVTNNFIYDDLKA